MGIFSKKQSPDMSPLVSWVELPKGGEPIVFDEEEQRAMDEGVKRQLEYFRHDTEGRVFPAEVIETLSVKYATDALRNFVNHRIYNGDLKGAASTCIKLVGVSGGTKDIKGLSREGRLLQAIERNADWLLLAKILALHGDIVGSSNFVNFATKEVSKYGGTEDAKAYWESKVQVVEDIIKSKESEDE